MKTNIVSFPHPPAAFSFRDMRSSRTKTNLRKDRRKLITQRTGATTLFEDSKCAWMNRRSEFVRAFHRSNVLSERLTDRQVDSFPGFLRNYSDFAANSVDLIPCQPCQIA